MQCKWGACCFNVHNRHYVRINQSVYASSKLSCRTCCSIRADSSSQNSNGNNGGKNHGFLYQNVGNDRWQEPLHTERNTRCIIHDARAHHVVFIAKTRQAHVFTRCTHALIWRVIRGSPSRSADRESAEIDVGEQTIGAALVQNGNIDNCVHIYVEGTRHYLM